MDKFRELTNSINELGKITAANMDNLIPKFSIPEINFPDFEPIDPENTILGDIKRQLEEHNSIANSEIKILIQQNQLLSDNYDKLKELYDRQVQAYEESNKELEKTRKYNAWMMIIAIIAMLAAVAGPIVTLYLSGA